MADPTRPLKIMAAGGQQQQQLSSLWCLLASNDVERSLVIETSQPMSFTGIAGAISRTCTAPVDRLKMLLQIQDGAQALTLRGGIQKMAAEGM